MSTRATPRAGTGSSTPFVEMELSEWQHVLDVDLTGAFLAGQEAAGG
jgi:NAD(P)-dependent dehydrogenase (short-subunit alcohol dehydrogenase family)